MCSPILAQGVAFAGAAAMGTAVTATSRSETPVKETAPPFTVYEQQAVVTAT